MPTQVVNGGRLHAQAAAFSAALEAREDAAALSMLGHWSDAYWAIRKDMDNLLAQVEAARLAGVKVSPSWVTRQARYKNLLSTAKREMTKYAHAAGDTITAQQRSALQAAVKDAERLAKTAAAESLGKVAADLIDINPANVDAAVGFLQDGTVLSDHLTKTLARTAPGELRDVLVQGLARGKSQDWMVRQFTRALSTSHSRAVTILRTESLRAYRSASQAVYQQNAHVVQDWVWRCALDTRSCMACVVMNGTHHPLGESLDGHPRCRCVMVPHTKSWADMGVPGIEDTRPTVETGTDWFHRQTPATQRAMMGPQKYDAWKGGEFDLPDLVARHSDPGWGTMRSEASLKAIRANRVPRAPEPQPTIPEPAARVPAEPDTGTLGDRLPRKPNWKPYDDPTSVQGILDQNRTNPKWSRTAIDQGYQVNCTNSVTAYELRRRGFDVTAAARPGGVAARGRPVGDVADAWGVPDAEVHADMTWAEMDQAIVRDMPDGARGAVTLAWKGGGYHIVNWEKVQGRVVFTEAQLPDANRFFHLNEFLKNAEAKPIWWRHDHLSLRDALEEYLEWRT